MAERIEEHSSKVLMWEYIKKCRFVMAKLHRELEKAERELADLKRDMYSSKQVRRYEDAKF